MTDSKCVILIDENLPTGVIANTAAVLGISLGNLRPDMIGRNLEDNNGNTCQGITTVAIPILKGNAELFSSMREKLREFEPDLVVVDLIGATRTTKSYEEYAKVLKDTPVDQLEYLGLALSGPKKVVNKFTGSLSLLR